MPGLASKKVEIRSRIAPDLKKRADRVLAGKGLKMSDAIRLFLHQLVAENDLRCESPAPSAKTRVAMEDARKIKKGRFKTAKALFDDLEKNAALQTGRRAAKQR